MNHKVCCFAQRQDGCVVGLVVVGPDKKMDLSTARFVTVDAEENSNFADLAEVEFKRATNVRSRNHLKLYTHESEGTTTHIVDMEVIQPMTPKTNDPNVIVSWVNPYHLVNGPDGDVARAIFTWNATPVSKPPEYQYRKNKDFVPADDNIDQDP